MGIYTGKVMSLYWNIALTFLSQGIHHNQWIPYTKGQSTVIILEKADPVIEELNCN